MAQIITRSNTIRPQNRAPDATDAQYKTAIMKWEVYNLLPMLKVRLWKYLSSVVLMRWFRTRKLKHSSPRLHVCSIWTLWVTWRSSLKVTRKNRMKSSVTKWFFVREVSTSEPCSRWVTPNVGFDTRQMSNPPSSLKAGFKESGLTELRIDDCSYDGQSQLFHYMSSSCQTDNLQRSCSCSNITTLTTTRLKTSPWSWTY